MIVRRYLPYKLSTCWTVTRTCISISYIQLGCTLCSVLCSNSNCNCNRFAHWNRVVDLSNDAISIHFINTNIDSSSSSSNNRQVQLVVALSLDIYHRRLRCIGKFIQISPWQQSRVSIQVKSLPNGRILIGELPPFLFLFLSFVSIWYHYATRDAESTTCLVLIWIDDLIFLFVKKGKKYFPRPHIL